MASYTIYAASSDGFITSDSTTYSTARAGNNLAADTGAGIIYIGQNRVGSTRDCREGFFAFDCSSVTGTATAATISLYGFSDESTTDFTIEGRARTWSASGLTTADWVAGASLSGLTLLASMSTASFATSAYNALTSEAALLTAVDAHGSLEVLFSSSRHRGNNDPSNSERVQVRSTNASGTAEDPKIDITTVDPGNPWNYYAQLQ